MGNDPFTLDKLRRECEELQAWTERAKQRTSELRARFEELQAHPSEKPLELPAEKSYNPVKVI